MFELACVFTGVVVVGLGLVIHGAFWSKNGGETFFGLNLVVVGLFVAVGLFNTPGAKLTMQRIGAAGTGHNWLVVDNSGGQTMRHWVLIERYVTAAEQSDGWQFTDEHGNVCYVGGDAFVQQIKQPMDEWHEGYRERYSIPADQTALQ